MSPFLAKRYYVFLFSLFLFLLSCSAKNDKTLPLEVNYLVGRQISKRNQILFGVENPNSRCIIFPYDFGAQVFYIKNDKLFQAKNILEYSPKSDITLDAKGGDFSSSVIGIRIDFSNIEIGSPVNFSLKISGTLCESKESFTQEIPFTIVP